MIPVEDDDELASIQLEIDFLAACDHPNVVRYLVIPRFMRTLQTCCGLIRGLLRSCPCFICPGVEMRSLWRRSAAAVGESRAVKLVLPSVWPYSKPQLRLVVMRRKWLKQTQPVYRCPGQLRIGGLLGSKGDAVSA